MFILCKKRLEEALQFAKENNDPSLQKCLDTLKEEEEHPMFLGDISLDAHDAPYSFVFRETLLLLGETVIEGSILYHGTFDGSWPYPTKPPTGWYIEYQYRYDT